MRRRSVLAIVLLLSTPAVHAQNLIRNGSFEQFDQARQPANWQVAEGAQSLQFTGQHHHGANSALLSGDGTTRSWPQRLEAPRLKTFRLSVEAQTPHGCHGLSTTRGTPTRS